MRNAEEQADATPEHPQVHRQYTNDDFMRAFYRVKREYGVVTPPTRTRARFEFEIKEGRLVKPKGHESVGGRGV